MSWLWVLFPRTSLCLGKCKYSQIFTQCTWTSWFSAWFLLDTKMAALLLLKLSEDVRWVRHVGLGIASSWIIQTSSSNTGGRGLPSQGQNLQHGVQSRIHNLCRQEDPHSLDMFCSPSQIYHPNNLFFPWRGGNEKWQVAKSAPLGHVIHKESHSTGDTLRHTSI